MTTSVATTSVTTSAIYSHQGTLETDVKVDYGQAGGLIPLTFALKQTVTTEARGDVVKPAVVSYQLNFAAKNRNGMNFRASYGYPYPTTLHQEDYGYGGAGLIKQVPRELLEAVSTITGIDLVGLD